MVLQTRKTDMSKSDFETSTFFYQLFFNLFTSDINRSVELKYFSRRRNFTALGGESNIDSLEERGEFSSPGRPISHCCQKLT